MCEIGGADQKIFLSKRPAPAGRVGAGFSGEHSNPVVCSINITFLSTYKPVIALSIFLLNFNNSNYILGD